MHYLATRSPMHASPSKILLPGNRRYEKPPLSSSLKQIAIALTPADPHTLKVNFVVTSSSSLKRKIHKQKLLLQMPIDTGFDINPFSTYHCLSKILASSSCQQEFEVVPMILLFDIILESSCCRFDFTICINVGLNLFMKLVS